MPDGGSSQWPDPIMFVSCRGVRRCECGQVCGRLTSSRCWNGCHHYGARSDLAGAGSVTLFGGKRILDVNWILLAFGSCVGDSSGQTRRHDEPHSTGGRRTEDTTLCFCALASVVGSARFCVGFLAIGGGIPGVLRDEGCTIGAVTLRSSMVNLQLHMETMFLSVAISRIESTSHIIPKCDYRHCTGPLVKRVILPQLICGGGCIPLFSRFPPGFYALG